MKIGYICSDPDVQIFGFEGCSVHVREFINALSQAGHDVFLLGSWIGDPAKANLQARVYHIQPSGLNGAAWRAIETEPVIQNHYLERDLRSVLWNLWLQQEGAAILEQERPDFLYERYALFGSGGLELSRARGIPLVMELNAPLTIQQDGYRRFTLTETAKCLEAEVLKGADAVVALTHWLKAWAISVGVDGAQIQVIPDGVSDRLFSGEISGDAIRAEYRLAGKRVIGFVGSFHWWHDVSTLLQAFACLHRNNPDLRLLLVGSGDTRKRAANQAEQLGLDSSVIFTGRVPHEKVPEYVAAMDVAVVPYKPAKDFYFSPLKLFECMAAGKPTVAAAIGEIPDIVQPGKTGCLYSPGDAGELAKRIETLLSQPELAQRLGNSGRERVLSAYTWRAITARVTGLVQELLTHPKFAGGN